MDYIEGDIDTPPPELRFVMRVDRWGNPTGGGWHDWPAGMVRKASYVDSIYRAYSGYKSSGSHTTEWASRHPQEYELVTSLLEQRIKRLKELTPNGD